MWFWSRRCPQFVALSRPPLSASPEILRLHSILITRINQPHDQPGGTSARCILRNHEFARRDVNQFRYMIGNTNISKKLSVDKYLNHRKNIQPCPIFAPFQTLQLVTLFRAPSWSWKTELRNKQTKRSLDSTEFPVDSHLWYSIKELPFSKPNVTAAQHSQKITLKSNQPLRWSWHSPSMTLQNFWILVTLPLQCLVTFSLRKLLTPLLHSKYSKSLHGIAEANEEAVFEIKANTHHITPPISANDIQLSTVVVPTYQHLAMLNLWIFEETRNVGDVTLWTLASSSRT